MTDNWTVEEPPEEPSYKRERVSPRSRERLRRLGEGLTDVGSWAAQAAIQAAAALLDDWPW